MHQTTVRFPAALWGELEQQASREGVSVAQYVREAALARLAYTAGRRGDPMYAEGLGESEAASRGAVPSPDSVDSTVAGFNQAREHALSHFEESVALRAQGQLARARARELAQRASRLRRRQPAPRPGT